ncbi:dihydroxyacetone phosphate acyltransferase-like [Clupea harengus]|uniref:Dihydroxyacetone phosphate acyltransferase-like n=1 Tax=Clupea harengus TaxID=7950 RepID=A0A8M1KJ58_CLUHA|nr:dihydroxyacetone phosphate acyltransferase-like [Clupea harengus]
MENHLLTCTEKTHDPGAFLDILEERRRTSDLSHALRTFSPQPYKGHPQSSARALTQAVLDSQYLRDITQEIATESGNPVEVIREEASGILKEMSHNQQLSSIRLLGYTLSKVFKKIFRTILVNEDGLNRLREAIQEHPVILLPNHRSYVDFLVLSYILFTYDLSIPVIAAGVPLMGVRLIGELLRRSGAFFIRRAIRADKLYWAVLSEYVRTIVRVRAFGRLSHHSFKIDRKSFSDCMMDMVLEPFFKGEVYDINLVPISISYDWVLDESLLAHELPGFPKPKESIIGLLKARKVLEDDYGSMHVCFGQPISVRELANGRINHSQYNLVPRDMPQNPSEETRAFVSVVAHGVVRLQERAPRAWAWTPSPSAPPGYGGWVLKFGAKLDWPAEVSNEEVMSSSLSLHQSMVCCEGSRVLLLEEQGPGGEASVTPEAGVLKRAVVMLMCASYRNLALHVFVRPTLVAVAMATTPSTRKEDVFTHFKFLQELFSNEFVFVPGMAAQDFEEGCSLLVRCGAVQTSDQELVVTEHGTDTASFLRAILQPFLQTYQVIFRHLTEDSALVFTERQYIPAVQSYCLKLILAGELQTHEALSSDIQKNVLYALVRLNAVTKTKVGDQSEFTVNKAAIQRIGDILGTRSSVFPAVL